ncbi:MAG: DUF362 domain-containing protein [Thermodesulfovibrionales bacterium]|nr:DUF362 domain-containing protein [Thermodesulfovibrionales bacterium]
MAEKVANVYFASARVKKWKYSESLPGKLERLLKEINLNNYFEKGEWVAIKTHFGSDGAHRIVRPVFLRKVVEGLKSIGAKPFITDTVRIKGLDYLEVANQNGINHLSCGAPVVLADGLYGNDNIMVKAGEILGEIAVASVIYDVPAMVVCSHFKGHINAGFGGAIKNLAMGAVSGAHRHCGWKCGRGAMHTIGEGMLIWDKEKCELCLQCEEICPLECIEFKEGEFSYDDERCWRCGRCTRVCPEGALMLPGDDELFMRSLAEAAMAVLSTFKPGKVIYINFLTEIQPECDCMPAAEVPVIQDQGILISDDIVAIEQASLDLITGKAPLPQSLAEDMGIKPGDDILLGLHKKPYILQIEEAERLGLGTRKYNLSTLS